MAGGPFPCGTISGMNTSPLPPATVAEPAPAGSRSARLSGWTEPVEHGLVPLAEGVRLHYAAVGQGEPVLLLPGWPQSWHAWRFVLPLLALAGRRSYAVDPRGFGDSDAPASGYDLATAAEDVHALIGQLGLTSASAGVGVDIVSHDVGSWIAYAHAVAHPEDVRRLVLTDAYLPGVSPAPPAGLPSEAQNLRQWHFAFNRVAGLPEALIHGREREFLAWFFGPAKLARTWSIAPEAFEKYLRVFAKPGAVRAGLQYYREVFSSDGLAASKERTATTLTMPILTLGGAYADSDNLLTTMRPLATDVRGHVFEGIGHHLPEECPQELTQTILDFWND